MNEKTNSKTTVLSKQKKLIMILAGAAAFAALLCIVLPIIFKEEQHIVKVVNDRGDYVLVTVTDSLGSTIGTASCDAETDGITIGSKHADMLSGNLKNEHNVKKLSGENEAYSFNLNGAEISERPFIFKEIPLEKVQKVTVDRNDASICVYRYEDNFFIEGAESNLYNQQQLSELIFQARYMLSQGYVENAKQLSDYGLDADGWSALVTVQDVDGNTFKVIIGDKTATGSGYYMTLDGGENVYIMDDSVDVFFDSILTYLSPAVISPIEEQQRNYIEKFALAKNGEPFFACEIIPEEDQVGIYVNQLHKMTYPKPEYVLNTMTLYEMFSKVGALSGTAVIEYGISKLDENTLSSIKANYGLDTPTAEIGFSYGGKFYSITVGKSENVDGEIYYYVYSEYQDTITIVSSASLDFLEYELVDLYQTNIFQYNITEVSSVDVRYGGNNFCYTLSGSAKDLKVVESVSGKLVDTPSFRQFYISLLNITIGGYSEVQGADAGLLKHELTFIVTLNDGSKLVYEFYSESTMSCYMIVDGKGGFKTDRKWIDTIVKHSNMLLNGEEIASQY